MLCCFIDGVEDGGWVMLINLLKNFGNFFDMVWGRWVSM